MLDFIDLHAIRDEIDSVCSIQPEANQHVVCSRELTKRPTQYPVLFQFPLSKCLQI